MPRSALSRTTAPMPLDPHLRRLTALGVRWVDHPEDAPTGAAPEQEVPSTSGRVDTTDDANDADRGYPEGVPVRDMTPEQRRAYDHAKREENRQRREQWNAVLGDRTPDDVRAELEELAQLRRSRETAEETALREAHEAGRHEAAQQMLTTVATSSLVAHLTAAGLSDDDAAGLVGVIDPTKFLADGDVDLEKVREFTARHAPAKGAPQWPATGRGNPTPPAISGLEAGRDRYRRNKRDTTHA